jgi:ATP-dependent Zn protease
MRGHHPRRDERTIAFHEAGHAVIAAHLGLEIGPVTIVPIEGPTPGERILGLATVTNPLRQWRRGDGPRRELMESYVVALFAGCTAEAVLHNSEQEIVGEDYELARYWLNEMPPRGASYIEDEVCERYEHKLLRRALQLVECYFAEIRTIAELLLERRILQPDEIFEALGMQAN